MEKYFDRPKLTESLFLTNETAKQAIDLALPEINKLVDDGTFGSPDMYVAIAIPIRDETGNYDFEILAEKKLGDVDKWQDEYQDFALNKINFVARTGISVREALLECPHLILEGDGIYPGAITKKGIIAACSSVEGWDLEDDELDPDDKVCEILMDKLFELMQSKLHHSLGQAMLKGQHIFLKDLI